MFQDGSAEVLWFILIEAPNDALKTSQLGDESQSFSLISQRGQPADSNRFQQIRNGPSFCCHQSQWQLFWQLFIFRGPRKDSHVCLESPSPKHWISLDITGYHWISLDTELHSDTIWYNLIQSDTDTSNSLAKALCHRLPSPEGYTLRMPVKMLQAGLQQDISRDRQLSCQFKGIIPCHVLDTDLWAKADSKPDLESLQIVLGLLKGFKSSALCHGDIWCKMIRISQKFAKCQKRVAQNYHRAFSFLFRKWQHRNSPSDNTLSRNQEINWDSLQSLRRLFQLATMELHPER